MRAISPLVNRLYTSGEYNRSIGQASRYLFYSHDGLGLGHLRRNLSIASALVELDPHASILLATSTDEVEQFAMPARVDVLKLPGLRKVDNGHYRSRRLRMTGGELCVLRASLLGAAVESFRPAVFLADKHPFGIRGELEPALETARAVGTRAVLGFRDVLDDAASVRAEWREGGLFDRISEYYDRVLVYGQPDVLDPRREYGFPAELTAVTRFCGYVVSPAVAGRWADDRPLALAPEPRDRPLVLATAGGGEDGYALLSTFVEAAASAFWEGVVVSGPHSDPSLARRLRRHAEDAGVTFRRFVPGLSSEFHAFDALVCMGGYNTLAEAIASNVPLVCVPRVRPRREQLIRGRAFARRGLLRLLEPDRLDAVTLRAEVELALAARRRHAVSGVRPLDLGGARRAARHLLELAPAGRSAEAGGVRAG